MILEPATPLTHAKVDRHQAYLYLTCACGASRLVSTSMQAVLQTVDVTGWQLATMGSRERDLCPGCVASEAARRILAERPQRLRAA